MKKIAKIRDNEQFDCKIIELDPNLLQTPFKIQTNWVVITGSACTGKTTMINLLADKGFSIVPETAREYIVQELAKGRVIEEIITNPMTQLEIIKLQVSAESSEAINVSDLVFLDRGLPDSLTFYRYNRLDPNSILIECFQKQYALVFILDRLPLQLDGARIANEAFLSYLDTWLEKDYSALGYQVIRVPAKSPQERLEFILDILSQNKLI